MPSTTKSITPRATILTQSFIPSFWHGLPNAPRYRPGRSRGPVVDRRERVRGSVLLAPTDPLVVAHGARGSVMPGDPERGPVPTMAAIDNDYH